MATKRRDAKKMVTKRRGPKMRSPKKMATKRRALKIGQRVRVTLVTWSMVGG